MHRHEFLLAARLEAHALEMWIEAGWLVPRKKSKAGPFSDIDVARAQLIHDLGKLGVNEEGIPIILDLLDQLHGMRRTMRGLLSSMAAQTKPGRSKRRIQR